MRILVTGGAGYIGSLLVPMLLDAGHEVTVVDTMQHGQASLMSSVANPRFEFVRGDVRDERIMRESINKADAIVHLAAVVGMPACQRDPELAESVNVRATQQIMRLRSVDQPVFYGSTGSNYGAVEGVCTEETPLNPLSVYAVTKTGGEEAVLEKPNTLGYRFATAFGVAPRLRLDLLPNDFVFQAVNNGSIVVYEKAFRRTLIHVRDIARAWMHAIENFDTMKDNVYNVGDESLNMTKQAMIEKLQQYVPFTVYYADAEWDPDKRDYEVSYEKIRKTGYGTTLSYEEGILELTKALNMVTIPNPYANVDR